MKFIRLDASQWQSADDFYSALLPELGAPTWHGRNLDALHDSLAGGINRTDPPLTIEITSAEQLSSNMAAFLTEVAAVFRDAREQFKIDVSLQVNR
jgi:RNAse (barnase) inhibitor barstar